MTTDLAIWLVRHAQTEYNAAARLQGWCDSPLTAAGRQAAAALGRALQQTPFQAAFCSTLPRTAATAQVILQAAEQSSVSLTALDNLREYRFGSRFESRPAVELYEAMAAARGLPDAAAWLHAYRHGRHNLLAQTLPTLDAEAETEAQFVGRVRRGLDEVIARSPARGRVLVVTHGMAIVALLKSLNPDAIAYQSPPNVSVSRLHYDGSSLHLCSVGETLAA